MGFNGFGRLGDGSRTNRFVSVLVNTNNASHESFKRTIIAHVSVGRAHTIALGIKGDVYTWGRGGNMQLGFQIPNYNNGLRDHPRIPILLGVPIIQVLATRISSFALSANGTIYAWGWNGNGELGQNASFNSGILTPTIVSGILSNKKIVSIGNSGQHTVVAVDEDGVAYTWGRSISSTNILTPTIVENPFPRRKFIGATSGGWNPPFNSFLYEQTTCFGVSVD